MQQLQVQENVVGFEKALGAVKMIKDQIQYRSQSLLNLYYIHTKTLNYLRSGVEFDMNDIFYEFKHLHYF